MNISSKSQRWALTPVLDWLLLEGRLMMETGAFIDALGERLLAVGAPLWRLSCGFQTIHPQVLSWTFLWYRDQGPSRSTRRVHGIQFTDAYLGSPMQEIHISGRSVRHRLRNLDPEQAHPTLLQIAAEGGVDYVGFPILFMDGKINPIFFATDHTDGFSATDIEQLHRLTLHLAAVFEVQALRRIAVALLDTYIGHRSGEKVLSGLIKRGDSEIIPAALWFSDLRDFTPLTESLPPEQLLALLNAYFEIVAAAVTARGGEVLRFIGDAMLIVFPVTQGDAPKAACAAALDAYCDARVNIATLNHRRRRLNEPEIRFGVGLHVGEVIYGNVGAPDRLDFTVMGPAVNRTARLESLTKQLGPPLLISADFAAAIDEPTRSLGYHPMKGVAELQEIFTLEEL